MPANRFNSVRNPELVEQACHGNPVMGAIATCPWESRNAASDAIVPHAVIGLPQEWSHRRWGCHQGKLPTGVSSDDEMCLDGPHVLQNLTCLDHRQPLL